MIVRELIELLQKEDPTKKVYVPFTTYMSPASKPKVVDCVFTDGDGVMICSESAEDNDDG